MLAINPSAQVELKKEGIPFINSGRYFTNIDHKSVSEKSHQITNVSEDTFTLKIILGVKHAYQTEFINYFSIFISTIFVDPYYLDNVVRDLNVLRFMFDYQPNLATSRSI